MEKYFFNKILLFTYWKRIFRLVETVLIFLFFYFFVQTFFLLVEPSLKLVEEIVKERANFNWCTDFQASGTHFLSFSQTAVNCSLRKEFIHQLEHVFQSMLHSTCWKQALCLLKTVLLYSEFFLLVETIIIETWGKSI